MHAGKKRKKVESVCKVNLLNFWALADRERARKRKKGKEVV